MPIANLLWKLPLCLRNATEVRHVSGVSLNGRLVERPLCESIKLKGLPWRIQDVRVMGYLQIRASNREWNQSRRKKCVAVNKAEQTWRCGKRLDIRHGAAEFVVCPAGFQSCLGLVFPHNAFFPAFWNT